MFRGRISNSLSAREGGNTAVLSLLHVLALHLVDGVPDKRATLRFLKGKGIVDVT